MHTSSMEKNTLPRYWFPTYSSEIFDMVFRQNFLQNMFHIMKNIFEKVACLFF